MAHAVVNATTAAHRVFLQHPQPRGGLAGIGQLDAAALQIRHKSRRCGGNARQTHGQVQRCALPGHQSRRRTQQLEKAVPLGDGSTVLDQQPHLHLPIEALKQTPHQRPATEAAGLLGDPMRLPLTPLQGRRTQIAAAEVFIQPLIQGTGERRGLPVHRGIDDSAEAICRCRTAKTPDPALPR